MQRKEKDNRPLRRLVVYSLTTSLLVVLIGYTYGYKRCLTDIKYPVMYAYKKYPLPIFCVGKFLATTHISS